MTKSSVLTDLKTWGPDRVAGTTLSLAEAQAYCRQLAQSHYENFPVVTWLLPKSLHQHFYNVYAYCRWADDLGDETGDSARSLELLAWWRGELEACCRGSASHPVFIALRSTIERFSIPQQPFADLISAFEQDQRLKEYKTFSQLVDYCSRSANPVGRLVLYLCEQFNENNAADADSICTGLQLANFWQDVARDWELGRIYLPREDRERFGYSMEDYRGRVINKAFVNLMEFEVSWARQYLMAGSPLVTRMPGILQFDIDLFRRGGLAILQKIERGRYRVWETRPKVSKWDVLTAGCSSLWSYISGTVSRSIGFPQHVGKE